MTQTIDSEDGRKPDCATALLKPICIFCFIYLCKPVNKEVINTVSIPHYWNTGTLFHMRTHERESLNKHKHFAVYAMHTCTHWNITPYIYIYIYI